MSEPRDDEVNNKTRYIKFKHNSSIGESADSEQGESEEATGGETASDETAVEQIFLETTVWIVKNSKNRRTPSTQTIIAALSTFLIIIHDPSSDLELNLLIAIILRSLTTNKHIFLFVQ